MDIGLVMRRLSRSEINCSLSSFWDSGWTVRLGDEVNGFASDAQFDTLEECAAYLDAKAKECFPNSVYAVGEEEHWRRSRLHAIRVTSEYEERSRIVSENGRSAGRGGCKLEVVYPGGSRGECTDSPRRRHHSSACNRNPAGLKETEMPTSITQEYVVRNLGQELG